MTVHELGQQLGQDTSADASHHDLISHTHFTGIGSAHFKCIYGDSGAISLMPHVPDVLEPE